MAKYNTEVVFKQQPRGLLRDNQFVLEKFQIEVRHSTVLERNVSFSWCPKLIVSLLVLMLSDEYMLKLFFIKVCF